MKRARRPRLTPGKITRRAALAGLGAMSSLGVWPALTADVPKFALLIGNRDYLPGVGRLRNPLNDVNLLRASLGTAGFPADRIKVVGNVTRADTLAAIGAHVRLLTAAGTDAIGFFYYCGHGAANDGRNYIIPVDARDARTARLWQESLATEDVFRLLSEFDGAQIAAFDCCRNELDLPGAVSPSTGATGAEPSPAAGSKGLVAVRAQAPRRNMLISYAAWEGETASDGREQENNGPYARAFDAAVRSRAGALPLVELFDQVRLQVLSATGDAQEPMNLSRMSAVGARITPFAAAAAQGVAPVAGNRPCALVISNTYASWAGPGDSQASDLALPFTARDGDLVADALRKSGFEVRRSKNLQRQQLLETAEAFAREAEGKVAVVYFSGYGAGLNGKNYLLPEPGAASVPPRSGDELTASGVPVSDLIVRFLQARVRALFIALDSSREFSLGAMPRGAEDLIEGMPEVSQAQPNVVISYSAAANTFAFVQRESSPYASALARRIQQPARRSLQVIARLVKVDVQHATGQRQSPWFQSASQVPIYFRDEQGLLLPGD